MSGRESSKRIRGTASSCAARTRASFSSMRPPRSAAFWSTSGWRNDIAARRLRRSPPAIRSNARGMTHFRSLLPARSQRCRALPSLRRLSFQRHTTAAGPFIFIALMSPVRRASSAVIRTTLSFRSVAADSTGKGEAPPAFIRFTGQVFPDGTLEIPRKWRLRQSGGDFRQDRPGLSVSLHHEGHARKRSWQGRPRRAAALYGGVPSAKLTFQNVQTKLIPRKIPEFDINHVLRVAGAHLFSCGG